MVEHFQKMLIGSAEEAENALNKLLALFNRGNKLPSWGRVRKVEVTRTGEVRLVGHMMAGIIYGLGHYRDEAGVVHIAAKGITPWQFDVEISPLERPGMGGSDNPDTIEGLDVGLFPGDADELQRIIHCLTGHLTKAMAAQN